MADPFRLQKIQNWAAEFAESDAAKGFPGALREVAAQVAETFLADACAVRDAEPSAVTESDLKAGLLTHLPRLAISSEAHANVPQLCAMFVEQLQGVGRIAPGRATPSFIRALRSAYTASVTNDSKNVSRETSAPAPKAKPIVRPGSKLGMNDPCPCGSGKKYKKCCKRLFES